MPDIPTSEPREVVLGDTIKWTRPDWSQLYPPGSWTLTYYFVSRNPSKAFSVVASNVGGVFLVDLGGVSGVQASFERVGQSGYEWSARVVQGAEKYTLANGFMSIAPEMVGVEGGTDRRSWAVQTRDILREVVKGRAGADVNSYMVGNKQVGKMTPEELRGWLGWFEELAQAELGAVSPSEGFNRRIKVGLNRGY